MKAANCELPAANCELRAANQICARPLRPPLADASVRSSQFAAGSSQFAAGSSQLFTLSAPPPGPPTAFAGGRRRSRRTDGIGVERREPEWARVRRSGRRTRGRPAQSSRMPRSTAAQPCRRTGARCLTTDWGGSGKLDEACVLSVRAGGRSVKGQGSGVRSQGSGVERGRRASRERPSSDERGSFAAAPFHPGSLTPDPQNKGPSQLEMALSRCRACSDE